MLEEDKLKLELNHIKELIDLNNILSQSSVKPCLMVSEEFVKELLDNGILCDEEYEDRYEEEHQVKFVLMYLIAKELLPMASLRQLFNGEEYTNYHIRLSDRLKEIEHTFNIKIK